MSPDLVMISGVFSVRFVFSPLLPSFSAWCSCQDLSCQSQYVSNLPPICWIISVFYSCCQRCVGSPVPNNLFCGLAFHLSLPSWLTSRLTAGEYWLFVLEYFVKPCLLSVDLGLINLWLSPNHLRLPRLNLFVFLKVWASSPSPLLLLNV